MELLEDNDIGEEPVKKEIQVGDVIRYVPHECHATKKDAEGDYPWIIGRLGRDGKTIEELEGQELDLFLAGIRRRGAAISKHSHLMGSDTPAARQLAQQVKLVRPRKTWPATVTAVNGDGTVDLDIRGANSAVTLHCSNVKIDCNKSCHHTCHCEEGE